MAAKKEKKIRLTKYTDYIVEKTTELLNIDSPTGYTEEAAAWVKAQFESLGFEATLTNKGGVLVNLTGKKKNDGLLLEAHVDTLGGMVATIKENGRLQLTNLGGMNPNNAETENVRVVTKFDGIYEGTFQLNNASIHVNGDYNDTKRKWDTCEVVLDEDVKSRKDAEKLGISVGDIVCFEPNVRVTKTGYIKSRFLDDKLSVGILLGFARYIAEQKITPKRALYAHITVFEEVGHGGCANVPEGCTEAISVDMGCVGDGLTCTERQVSICAKDSGGPYSYPVVKGLVAAAKKCGADYAVDIYPHYGSDVEATLGAGSDVKHGLIGAGVYASHGYERSHRDGAENVLRLLIGYAL
ncbi:MAG: M42 family metallopeptidase [Lachnospiraceae bacterium]|nr:M42 family metallopeptidase [Lachnospiraceae bacterium]